MPESLPDREATDADSDPVPDPPDPAPHDNLDEQELESFPASDPHSDWAGPSN
jgi:hypothetical protein